MKNLVLTGYGWEEYAVAAAAAVRALDGKCDVQGVSRRHLPELLENPDPQWRTIYILGVGLSSNPPRLAAALKALRKQGVKVSWISALPPGEDACAELSSALSMNVFEGEDLLGAVACHFKMDASPLRPYQDTTRRPSAGVQAFRELLKAAQFVYRNYQDPSIYATAIRYLAQDVSPASWGDAAKEAVAHYRRYGGRELVGKSVQMRTLQARINRIAEFPDARVLILGESGTGKETVASQIHNKSPRRGDPFLAFNCASVNPDLLEERFFGHERGAFTGADRQQPGLFELADGGTLFLDEIGELPLEAQGVLLRVLEGGRFMRIGGREELSANVRLITATNRNLPRRVREGKFRADLYQRLNVVLLRIPPLREHKEDIRDIADSWWLAHHRRHLPEACISALMDYDYPGNVRELVNLLDRATVLGETDFAALLREHREMNADLLSDVSDGTAAGPADADVPDDLEAATRLHVRHVFEKYDRNLTRAAEALGVSRNTARKYL